MAKSQAVPAPLASPLQGNVPTFDPAEFQKRFDAWLKQNEAAKPFVRLRELAGRIAEGERRLSAAEREGKASGEGYERGAAKLAAYKAERDELTRTAQIPHFAFATVHNFLRASRGWNLPKGSRIEIRVPGVFDVAVDLAESEIPF